LVAAAQAPALLVLTEQAEATPASQTLRLQLAVEVAVRLVTAAQTPALTVALVVAAVVLTVDAQHLRAVLAHLDKDLTAVTAYL